jgi:hypothetical protein
LQEQIRNYDQHNADEPCQVEQMEAHGYRHGAIARRSESRVPAAHYNHCRDQFSTARAEQRQMLMRYTRVDRSRQSADETISCFESRSVFRDVIICVLVERARRFGTRICLSGAARDYDQMGTPIS